MGKTRLSYLWSNETHRVLFLEPFAKLREVSISFVTSFHPPKWDNSVPTGFFENLSRKF